jgi:hypothetical protein
MTGRVLELNDAGLRLSDETGVLLSSPGYALVMPRRIEFGESARSQSRLNPLHCFNQFWHRLSLDPFPRPVAHFRHNADLAYSHLQDLARTAELEGDVLLAVPGSFSRTQLGILLGLIKSSPLRAVGIVDSSLAAALARPVQDSLIHVDLQLHQVVLTRLQRQGEEIVRENVALVPGTGWVNLSDSLLQLFTQAFIAQCRFNPQHNAESEQKLLDALPFWLLQEGDSVQELGTRDEEDARPTLQIRLEHKGTVHQARLPRSSLQQRLQPFFHKIVQQIAALDPQGESSLLLSERVQTLPGLADYLLSQVGGGVRGTVSHDEHTIARICREYGSALISPADTVAHVTRLRVATVGPRAQAPAVQLPQPTHLLLAHEARRLRDDLQLLVDEAGAMQLPRPGQHPVPGLRLLGTIVREDGHFAVHALQGLQGLQINGQPLHGAHRLALGDRLLTAEGRLLCDVIRVREHDE